MNSSIRFACANVFVLITGHGKGSCLERFPWGQAVLCSEWPSLFNFPPPYPLKKPSILHSPYLGVPESMYIGPPPRKLTSPPPVIFIPAFFRHYRSLPFAAETQSLFQQPSENSFYSSFCFFFLFICLLRFRPLDLILFSARGFMIRSSTSLAAPH